MSVVKNKNNTKKHEQLTTINNKQLRPHNPENIGLIEQQKTDGSWPIHSNTRHVPRKAHTAKKIFF